VLVRNVPVRRTTDRAMGRDGRVHDGGHVCRGPGGRRSLGASAPSPGGLPFRWAGIVAAGGSAGASGDLGNGGQRVDQGVASDGTTAGPGHENVDGVEGAVDGVIWSQSRSSRAAAAGDGWATSSSRPAWASRRSRRCFTGSASVWMATRRASASATAVPAACVRRFDARW
jgi:hypothetical protein